MVAKTGTFTQSTARSPSWSLDGKNFAVNIGNCSLPIWSIRELLRLPSTTSASRLRGITAQKKKISKTPLNVKVVSPTHKERSNTSWNWLKSDQRMMTDFCRYVVCTKEGVFFHVLTCKPGETPAFTRQWFPDGSSIEVLLDNRYKH